VVFDPLMKPLWDLEEGDKNVKRVGGGVESGKGKTVGTKFSYSVGQIVKVSSSRKKHMS